MSALSVTPLYALHREYGARFAPFAGYDMPIQYRDGILAEHAHSRTKAGLFDVSHMGQARLEGPNHAALAGSIEALCAADLKGLPVGRQRYTQWLNDSGGVIDDLMLSRPEGADGRLNIVVNAARKTVDYEFLAARLRAGAKLTPRPDRALLALQGPLAATVLARIAPGFETLPFMGVKAAGGLEVSRSGYTGEDGYEISLPADEAEAFARRLLREQEVALIGLGARDTLRLEAGLCLYGHELTEEIDPVEAGLSWSIPKRRRAEGGFPGAARIQAALVEGPKRRLVGLRLDGRAPAREGAEIVGAEGATVGIVTSGGFGPSVGAPIALGFVDSAVTAPGTELALMVRGKALPARIVPLPFHPHAYFRG
jgi:aminomethyltransferase